MPITIGSVEVDVIPNTQGIYERLRAGIVPAATRAGEDAGSAAGRAFGPAMASKVGDIGLAIGQQIGQQIANRIKDAVSDALKTGVTIGGQLIVPGPLPAGHHFAIYVDPTTENVQRQGIGLPARIDQPQQQP